MHPSTGTLLLAPMVHDWDMDSDDNTFRMDVAAIEPATDLNAEHYAVVIDGLLFDEFVENNFQCPALERFFPDFKEVKLYKVASLTETTANTEQNPMETIEEIKQYWDYTITTTQEFSTNENTRGDILNEGFAIYLTNPSKTLAPLFTSSSGSELSKMVRDAIDARLKGNTVSSERAAELTQLGEGRSKTPSNFSGPFRFDGDDILVWTGICAGVGAGIGAVGGITAVIVGSGSLVASGVFFGLAAGGALLGAVASTFEAFSRYDYRALERNRYRSARNRTFHMISDLESAEEIIRGHLILPKNNSDSIDLAMSHIKEAFSRRPKKLHNPLSGEIKSLYDDMQNGRDLDEVHAELQAILAALGNIEKSLSSEC